MRVVLSLVMVGSCIVGSAAAPSRARAVVPPQQPGASANYAFPSGAGMLFFYVKPDRIADFESVVGRLAETLDATEDPVRKQQAAGWRILKSVETTRDAAIYVFLFDPAIAGADYDPVKILSEKQPLDIQPLYDKLREATIRVERMGLTKLR
jgi:hypothetical protein